MTIQQVTADVVTRIEQADAESADAAAAFAAGRFEEWCQRRFEEVTKRVEAAGEHAIANAGGGGENG